VLSYAVSVVVVVVVSRCCCSCFRSFFLFSWWRSVEMQVTRCEIFLDFPSTSSSSTSSLFTRRRQKKKKEKAIENVSLPRRVLVRFFFFFFFFFLLRNDCSLSFILSSSSILQEYGKRVFFTSFLFCCKISYVISSPRDGYLFLPFECVFLNARRIRRLYIDNVDYYKT